MEPGVLCLPRRKTAINCVEKPTRLREVAALAPADAYQGLVAVLFGDPDANALVVASARFDVGVVSIHLVLGLVEVERLQSGLGGLGGGGRGVIDEHLKLAQAVDGLKVALFVEIDGAAARQSASGGQCQGAEKEGLGRNHA